MDDATQAPSNIVINGTEYTPEDAQTLIETGTKVRDLESKWNVKVDDVWPSYGKTREELKSTSAERDQLKQQIADFQAKQQAQVETPTDIKQAQEAARKLGIVLNDDLNGKYVSKDDLETWYTERRAKEKAEEEGVKSVLAEADKVAEEIKASGAPIPFKKKAVLAYASAYGITDLRQAYEDMNAEELAPWKEAQIAAKKGSSLKTLSSGGKKTPEEVRVTSDNSREMLREVLTKGE